MSARPLARPWGRGRRGPPPPLRPPQAGPGGAGSSLRARAAEVLAPRAVAHQPQAALCGPCRSRGPEDRARPDDLEDRRCAQVPEGGGPGIWEAAGDLGGGRRAGAAVSPVCFSLRTQMRGICEDPSEIPRPGSGECVPRPLASLPPLPSRTGGGAPGCSTVDKFRLQSRLWGQMGHNG